MYVDGPTKHSFQQEAKPGCTQRSQYVVFWTNYPTKLLPHNPHSTWNSPVFSCSSPVPFRRGCYDITDEMCEGCCCCQPPGPRPSPRGCRPLAVFTGDSVCSLHSSGPSSHNGKSLAAFHCLRRTQASAKKNKNKTRCSGFGSTFNGCRQTRCDSSVEVRRTHSAASQ